MEAKDLRIGNTVKDGNDYITLTKDAIMCILVGRCEFDPIPLTEGWLLKFGINTIKEDSPHFKNIFGNPHWMQVLLRTKAVVIHIGGGEHFTIGKIKHVHQLQNLYFALTGEELQTID